MDFESILGTIQPFVIMFAALFAAFLTAVWVSVIIWAFRDIRARSRDVFAQILATLMVLLFFPLFPFPGLILYMLLRPRETLSEIYERSLEEEALLQGIEERMACPGCNRRIEEQFMVCPTCHTRLKKACPACGRLLHLRWNLCPYCGAVQTTTKAATLLGTQPAVEAPKLADPTLSSSSQPATEIQTKAAWEVQPPPAYEPEAGPAIEEDAGYETIEAEYEPETEPSAEPEPEAPAESDEDSEADEDPRPGEDSEPHAETLPFEFD